MSEIFSGARYTLGGLIVLTLWSLGMVQFVEWKMGVEADYQSAEDIASDEALIQFAPGSNASDETRRRYHELRRAAGLE